MGSEARVMKGKTMDIEKDLQAVRNVFVNYPKQLKDAKDKLSNINDEIQDLLHVLEFGRLNGAQIMQVSSDLISARRTRREIKNEIEQLESIKKLFMYGVREHELNNIIGESRKVVTNQQCRSYDMRIRQDLQQFMEGS